MALTPQTRARRTAIVDAAEGLHARPAALFVHAAAAYDAKVWIAKGDSPAVDARSILGVLTLDVRHGDTVVLSAEGDDAEAAVQALAYLLTSPRDVPHD